MNYCEIWVAYVTENDEDPHLCGKPAFIREAVDGAMVWVCDECHDSMRHTD